ncbi:MAG TPA: hypothetical protein VGC87_09640 [Pyrinomonadaceae bacterium]|jgi:hypothetical protein
MYAWYFQGPEGQRDFDDIFLDSIHQVYLEGFGKSEGWSIEGIRETVMTSDILGFLRNGEGEIFGYAFYTVPSSSLDGTHILWADSICLKKGVQKKGLTTGLTKKAAKVFPERKFGWIGGRTQNPLVMRKYSKLGTVFPFSASYDTDEGKLVMDYLLKHIKEVFEVYEEQRLELTNGICRKVYRGGRLGDYPTAIDGTEAFEKQLLNWNFKRDNGDAIIIVSHLYQIIQAAS